MSGLNIPLSDFVSFRNIEPNGFGSFIIYSPLLTDAVNIPLRLVNGPITSTRSIILGQSSMSFSVKSEILKEIRLSDSDQKPLAFEQFLVMNSVVYLILQHSDGKYYQLNAGVIKNVSKTKSATGEEIRNIQCSGLDSILERFQVNLDFGTEDQNRNKRTEENISGALTQIKDLIKNQSSLQKAVCSIWDDLFSDFMQGLVFKTKIQFGGRNFIAKSGDSFESEGSDFAHLYLNACENAYSANFIQQVMVAGNLSVGGSGLGILDLLRQFAAPPLYEIFVDSLSSFPVSDESSNITPDNNGPLGFALDIGVLNEFYTVPTLSSILVFRKTPFCYFDYETRGRDGGKYQLEKGPHYIIDFGKLQSFSVNEDVSNIYSGVMVNPSISQLFGLVLSLPIYNTKLISIFGQNVLNVKIDGLSVKGDLTEKKKNQMKEALDKIKDMIFNIFCNPSNLKHLTGSLRMHFTPVRCGVPFKIKNKPTASMEKTDENLGLLGRYDADAMEYSLGDYGYITTVTDTIDPLGSASTQIDFKWMDCPLDFDESVTKGSGDFSLNQVA